jgi:hypothetical protein
VSLTRQLDDRASPISRYLRARFPHTRDLQRRHREPVAQTASLAPVDGAPVAYPTRRRRVGLAATVSAHPAARPARRARFTKEPQLVTARIYTLSVRRGSWFRSWGDRVVLGSVHRRPASPSTRAARVIHPGKEATHGLTGPKDVRLARRCPRGKAGGRSPTGCALRRSCS